MKKILIVMFFLTLITVNVIASDFTFFEDFNNTTYRDASNTTGFWTSTETRLGNSNLDTIAQLTQNNNTSRVFIAQSFVPPHNGVITGVNIWQNESHACTIAIRADNANQPSTTILYEQNGFCNSSIDFNSAVDVNTIVDRYWIVSNKLGGGTTSSVTNRDNPYANGTAIASADNIAWGNLGGHDLMFTVRMDYNLNANIIQSATIDSISQNIESAKLSVNDNLPSNTDINYFLSNNGGTNWLQFQDSNTLTFSTSGSDLRWKAELSSDSNSITPKIFDLTIDYNKSILEPVINSIDGFTAPFPFFSYVKDGNLTIDFNVTYQNADTFLIDFNYSTSSTQGTGNVLFDDVNIMDSRFTCDDFDFSDSTNCIFDFNINSDLVADEKYFGLFEFRESTTTEFVATVEFGVDNTVPTTTSDANTSTWQNFSANVNLSCSDGSGAGCALTQYRLDTDSSSAVSLGAWTNFSSNILVENDGNYVIDFNSTDNVGNVETTKRTIVLIDKNPPSTQWDGNHDVWQNTDANVHLTCVDVNGSGCALTQYRLDTDSSTAISFGSWQVFDTNILVAVDGNYVIDFNSTDVSGLTGDTNTFYILVDKTKPTINVFTPVDGNRTVVVRTVDFNVSDANSTVNKSSIQVDINGTISSVFNPNICTLFEFTYNCSYSETAFTVGEDFNITIFADDFAGNSAVQNEVIIRYVGDNNSPSVQLTFIDNFNLSFGLPLFSFISDGNLTIDFNVSDLDNQALTVDIFYGENALDFTNAIIEDLPLTASICADVNFLDSTECSWDWDISDIVADGNYFINIRVDDSIDTAIDSSDNNMMIDNTVPLLSNLSPVNAVTGSETNPQFSVNVTDNLSGISKCIAKKFVGGSLSETIDVVPSGSSCITNISLTEGVEGKVSWSAIDLAGNQSSFFSTAGYTFQTGGTTPSPPPVGGGGGGTGEPLTISPRSIDVNGFCVSDVDCKIDLLCSANRCLPAFGENFEHDLEHFIVFPIDITPPPNVAALPNSLLVLDKIFLSNNGSEDIEISPSFICSQEENCAKDWCSITRGLSNPVLAPAGFKEIFVECIIPPDTPIGETFFTQLRLQTDAGVQKNVLITIRTGETAIGEFSGLTGDIFTQIFDYGLLCFGSIKVDCLVSLSEAEPFGSFDSINVAFVLVAIFSLAALLVRRREIIIAAVFFGIIFIITLL